MSPPPSVNLGYVSGVYGVQGWVKVFSYTQPREQILDYQPWHIVAPDATGAAGQSQQVGATGRPHGKGLIAKLDGVDDRDAAAALIGHQIFVPRDALPEAEPGEYYWADLVGLAVRNRSGDELGRVSHLLETGAHDVLVLDGGENRLIPFVQGRVIIDVDLDQQVITVDWDAAWWE